MSDTRDQMAEHLKFFGELGVAGDRKDPVWAARPGGPADLKVGPTPDAAIDIWGDIGGRVQFYENGKIAPDPVAHLAAIREDIGECVRCKLCTLGRKQIVFGVGNPNADLMFVGEAPGRDEDSQGIPFVGRAGQKLTQIIEAIGLKREDVYIANVIKCRPPENRNPEPDEIAACIPFLKKQIEIIHPRVIVCLGKFASQTLLNTDIPISRLRGKWHEVKGIKFMPTYHPAYLLRNPGDKKLVWEDMKKIMEIYRAD